MQRNIAFGECPLREKSVIAAMIVLLLSLSVSLISITAGAEPHVGIYLSTNKPYYTYGESGKLYVTMRNEGPGPIEIKNISVTFSWLGWYHGGWDGNETITDIEDNLVGENDTSEIFEVPFTVPAEGRPGVSLGSSADVYVGYTYTDGFKYTPESSIAIPIELPVTQSPNLTPILYLMCVDTILLILVIIGLVYVWIRKPTSVLPAALATG
jgi:hypothetical protein